MPERHPASGFLPVSAFAVFVLAVSVLAVSVLGGTPAEACGPYPFDTRFWFDHRPGVAEHRAVRGELGVFEPQFDTAWVFAAWRQLAGPGLVESDREKLVWLLGGETEPWTYEDKGVDSWRNARQEATGESTGWIGTTRETTHEDGTSRTWNWFDNCLEDAFETAAETLRARVAAHGEHPAVQEWVRGQDAVFANCAGGVVDPTRAPDEASTIGWPDWLRKDRAYQRAAAALYSERYDLAAERFEAIAGDPESPWRVLSSYLVGRALARAGRYDAAIEQYRAVLEDPAAQELHASARGLLDHLLFRTDVPAIREDVTARLSATPLPESLEQDLVDFRRLGGGSLGAWHAALDGWTPPQEVVTRWRDASPGKARDAWRWAALLRANADDVVFDHGREFEALPRETLDELLAAETLEPGATGAVTEAYHRARLLLDIGRADQAIPILEGAMQGEYGSVATADLNRLKVQRLRASTKLAEVVRFGQMFPVAVGWNYDDDEPLADYDGELATWRGGALWHHAAAQVLNGLGARALAGLMTPESVEDELLTLETLRVAWTRAVILDDVPGTMALAERLAEIDAALSADLKPLLEAPGTERRFLAALAILRSPGLHPDLHAGVSRVPGLRELDSYRNNWWCEGETFLLPEPEQVEAQGFGAAETRDVVERLSRLPSGPNWLGRVVTDYADGHPDDPRVPEALHLVVSSTRRGCQWGPDGFAEISRAAFQRLHERYPNSEWTEKTLYWFE